VFTFSVCHKVRYSITLTLCRFVFRYSVFTLCRCYKVHFVSLCVVDLFHFCFSKMSRVGRYVAQQMAAQRSELSERIPRFVTTARDEHGEIKQFENNLMYRAFQQRVIGAMVLSESRVAEFFTLLRALGYTARYATQRGSTTRIWYVRGPWGRPTNISWEDLAGRYRDGTLAEASGPPHGSVLQPVSAVRFRDSTLNYERGLNARRQAREHRPGRGPPARNSAGFQIQRSWTN